MTMPVPNYTKHAGRRSSERAIPNLVVSLLIDYGRRSRSRGAWSYALDKQSRRRLRAAIGKVAYSRLKDLFDAYVIVSDEGHVITAAWRNSGRGRKGEGRDMVLH